MQQLLKIMHIRTSLGIAKEEKRKRQTTYKTQSCLWICHYCTVYAMTCNLLIETRNYSHISRFHQEIFLITRTRSEAPHENNIIVSRMKKFIRTIHVVCVHCTCTLELGCLNEDKYRSCIVR